jgi:hypothetical protein
MIYVLPTMRGKDSTSLLVLGSDICSGEKKRVLSQLNDYQQFTVVAV